MFLDNGYCYPGAEPAAIAELQLCLESDDDVFRRRLWKNWLLARLCEI